MKTRLAIASVALLMAVVGATAAAEPALHEGIVRSVDPQTDTVVLDDGSTFRAGEGVDVDVLRPGARVILYFYTYDGQKTVVSYEHVLRQ